MAKKQMQAPVDEVNAPPTPTPPSWLVGNCDETGVRVVHVAHRFYRESDGAVQECGTSDQGLPDGLWVSCASVPLKARSMLGLS